MLKTTIATAFVCATIVSSPALALIPTGLFDMNKEITLSGTVQEFQWTNPNVWIEVAAIDANGTPAAWSVEHASPNRLARQGWKSHSLKAGEKISLRIHPLKSGQNGGLLVSLSKADGTQLN